MRRGLLVALIGALTLLSAAASAHAYIYWTGGQIGRANLDGLSPDENFITGPSEGVAVDGAHVYWTDYQSRGIDRANLDGSSPDRSFISTGSDRVEGIAVDGAHVYWTDYGSGTIGRANLDGTSPDHSFITVSGSLSGVAVDGAHVYWSTGGGQIGRANLDGSSPDQSFITGTASSFGVAVDGAHVYWTEYQSGQIGRANLDGSTPDQSFITVGGSPDGIAVDGAHVYWLDSGRHFVGRAGLDGTEAVQLAGSASNSRGVAVDALGPPPEPVQGTTLNVVPRQGKVLVKLPLGAFVPLESLGEQIPVGSTLDTTKGTVRMFAATNGSGRTQHGDFSGGLFSVSQGRKNPLTTLSMTGGGLGSCGKLPPGGSPKVAAAARKSKRRRLFSSVKGHFSVRGRNSAATVRGTSFTMTDSCAGTLTQVRTGTVMVRDFRLRKTVKLKAGHTYFARRDNR